MSTVVFMERTPPLTRRFYIAKWAKKMQKRQRDIVAKTGLTKGFVSQLWSDKKKPGESLAAIADAIGVPQFVLLEDPDSPSSRAFVALARIPKAQQEIAVEMLEGLAERRQK